MDDEPRLVMRRTVPGRTYEQRDQNQLAVSADGSTVWTSEPFTAYDVATGAAVLRTGRHVYAMDLSPNGRTMALTQAQSRVNEVQLVDAHTAEPRRTLRGHTGDVAAVEFSHDGTRLASTSRDGEAVVWNTRSGASVERLDLGDTDALGLAFSRDDSLLFTAGSDGAVRSWDLDGSGRFLARTRRPGAFGFGWLQVSPGGTHTAHSADERMEFFDTDTGRSVVGEAVRSPDDPTDVCCYGGSFSPDGRLFAGSNDYRIWVWDVRTGALVRDNREHPWPEYLIDLAWTRDGSRILLTDDSGDLGMVDAQTLKPVGDTVHLGRTPAGTLAGPDNHTAFALVNHDPKAVANSFEVYPGFSEWALADLESGQIRRGEVGFSLWTMAVSPDQRRLALGGANGEVALVDVATGELVRPAMVAHEVPTYWSAWSADGSRFATSAWDGSVVLWDGRTGVPLGNVLVPEKVLTNIGFLPDGDTLILAPYTDSIYRWNTSIDHAVEFACRASAGDFDETDWETWFGSRPYQETCP
jgi:WD40 repeat protein